MLSYVAAVWILLSVIKNMSLSNIFSCHCMEKRGCKSHTNRKFLRCVWRFHTSDNFVCLILSICFGLLFENPCWLWININRENAPRKIQIESGWFFWLLQKTSYTILNGLSHTFGYRLSEPKKHSMILITCDIYRVHLQSPIFSMSQGLLTNKVWFVQHGILPWTWQGWNRYTLA